MITVCKAYETSGNSRIFVGWELVDDNGNVVKEIDRLRNKMVEWIYPKKETALRAAKYYNDMANSDEQSTR